MESPEIGEKEIKELQEIADSLNVPVGKLIDAILAGWLVKAKAGGVEKLFTETKGDENSN